MTATPKDLINLNAASQHELTQLPRIGVDKARRIVHYRAIRKGFRDWEDFAKISGITAEEVEAIRARAWIGPPAQPEPIDLDRGRTGHAEAMVRRPKAKAS